MTDRLDPKSVLKRYLQRAREALLWKLEGLDERALRMPRTPTGTNLIGIVKHAANVEIGYFGDTFRREWPTAERVPLALFDTEPQADWYATAEETTAGIVDFYRRVWAFADETIDSLPLDARGTVPWWAPAGAEVTLQLVLVHVIEDLSRHAGHADILRELADGSAGIAPDNSNLPEQIDWPEYVSMLEELAQRF